MDRLTRFGRLLYIEVQLLKLPQGQSISLPVEVDLYLALRQRIYRGNKNNTYKGTIVIGQDPDNTNNLIFNKLNEYGD